MNRPRLQTLKRVPGSMDKGQPGPQAKVDDLDLDSPHKLNDVPTSNGARLHGGGRPGPQVQASDPDLDSPHKVALGCVASYSCSSPLEPLISGPGWISGHHLAAPEAEGFESRLPLPASSLPSSRPLPAGASPSWASFFSKSSSSNSKRSEVAVHA